MTRAALALLLALAACGQQDSDARCPELPGGGRFCLQPSSALPPFTVQQKVDIRFSGRRETLIVQLEVDAEAMRVVGLTPFGQRLLEASYDGQRVRAPTLPERRLDPALLLAMMQLALWPDDAVRAGLSPALELVASSDRRRISDHGKLVVELSYTGGRPPFGDMHIGFPETHMEFDVTTLNSESDAADE